jgi:type II secretory pathway predicted ATPase ExeA
MHGGWPGFAPGSRGAGPARFVKAINGKPGQLSHDVYPMRTFVDVPYFVANPLQANALARLRHAVTFPGGLVVLSGGPGVGKTSFVRQALAAVDGDVQLLPVDLRGGDSADLFDGLLRGLGAASGESSGRSVIARLCEALQAQRTSGRQLILSLDVSGLNVDLARRLLRLQHLTGEQETPVSLILQGPHTLQKNLDIPGLIQLRQRLSFRHRARALTLLETAAYVRHCLSASGGNPDEQMAANAAASVYLYVAGVPRLINTLMDAVLGELAARQSGKIDAELVRQVAEQLGWKPIGNRGAADPASKPVSASTPRAAGLAAPRPAAPETGAVLPASDATLKLQIGRTADAPGAGATPAGTPAGNRTPFKESLPLPPVPMDEIDTGATGMLRLEDLDERFAETMFSEDSGHFKILVEAGKPN